VRQVDRAGAGRPARSAGGGGKQSGQSGGAFLRGYEARDSIRVLHIPGRTCEGAGIHGQRCAVGISRLPVGRVISDNSRYAGVSLYSRCNRSNSALSFFTAPASFGSSYTLFISRGSLITSNSSHSGGVSLSIAPAEPSARP